MDTDLPCLGVPVLFACMTLGGTGDRRPPTVDGVCSDSAGRCPRTCEGSNCEAKDELRDTEGLVDE
jgi:hypothetical protein